MLKQLVILFALISFLGVFTLAQEQPKKENKETKNHMEHMKSDSSMHGMMHNMKHDMKSDSSKNESIVHKGIIDLKSIDKNKDGKVYQDMMDWNVISDKPGQCPLCGMKLKEVSLDKAKENLLKHNFKVK